MGGAWKNDPTHYTDYTSSFLWNIIIRNPKKSRKMMEKKDRTDVGQQKSRPPAAAFSSKRRQVWASLFGLRPWVSLAKAKAVDLEREKNDLGYSL